MCLIQSADAMYIHENISIPHSASASIFTTLTCEQMDADKHFLSRWLFTDKVTFHVSEIMNTCNLIIWGTHSSISHKLERTSPKVNILCGVPCCKLGGPLFIHIHIIFGSPYLDMPAVSSISAAGQ
jgi:hypothetical protein